MCWFNSNSCTIIRCIRWFSSNRWCLDSNISRSRNVYLYSCSNKSLYYSSNSNGSSIGTSCTKCRYKRYLNNMCWFNSNSNTIIRCIRWFSSNRWSMVTNSSRSGNVYL